MGNFGGGPNSPSSRDPELHNTIFLTHRGLLLLLLVVQDIKSIYIESKSRSVYFTIIESKIEIPCKGLLPWVRFGRSEQVYYRD